MLPGELLGLRLSAAVGTVEVDVGVCVVFGVVLVAFLSSIKPQASRGATVESHEGALRTVKDFFEMPDGASFADQRGDVDGELGPIEGG